MEIWQHSTTILGTILMELCALKCVLFRLLIWAVWNRVLPKTPTILQRSGRVGILYQYQIHLRTKYLLSIICNLWKGNTVMIIVIFVGFITSAVVAIIIYLHIKILFFCKFFNTYNVFIYSTHYSQILVF